MMIERKTTKLYLNIETNIITVDLNNHFDIDKVFGKEGAEWCPQQYLKSHRPTHIIPHSTTHNIPPSHNKDSLALTS